MPENLNRGWLRVALGDVVRQVRDRVDPEKSGLERYVAGEHMATDDLKIRRWGLIGEGYLGPAFHMRFKPGQVLYGSRRTYLRKVAVADFSGITANTTFVMESKGSKVLLPELLPFVMQAESFHEHSIKQSKGSVNPYINFTDLTWYEFALPPLDEQRQIAEVLEVVDNVIQKYSDVLVYMSITRKSLAQKLLAEDLVWGTRQLKTLIQESLYGPRFSSDLYDKNGSLAQLRTTDLDRNGNINYGTIPRVRLDPMDFKEHLLRNRDLVISRSGTTGVTALFTAHGVPTIPAAFLIRLRTSEEMLPEYLHEYFSSIIGQQMTASLSRGGVQKNINGSELLALSVPCPELIRQRFVADCLQAARTAEELAARRIAKLKCFRSVCMRQFFEGAYHNF